MSDLGKDCPNCPHAAGSHSGGTIQHPSPQARCCRAGCTCTYSYRDIIAGVVPDPNPEPSQMDRIEAKLDTILTWITRQQLEEMERDLG